MSKYKIALSFLGLTLLVIESCKHETEPKPDDNIKVTETPVTVSDDCDFDTVYFVKEVFPIIQSNCTNSGCHSADNPADGVDLTTYGRIMAYGEIVPGDPSESKLYKKITETDPSEVMPPQGNTPLTSAEKRAIRIWIEQGALNNDCDDGCDTSDFTFSSAIWPILESTCRGCHSGQVPAGGVRITDYNATKAIVDDGRLEKSIFHLPGASKMPPGGQLDSCSMTKVRKWLDNGAPNN